MGANSTNKVIIVGNLGKDPEVKYTGGGLAVAQVTVATNERVKKNGEWVDHPEWHTVVLFGSSAEFAGQYLKKGRRVYVEGKLRTESWDDRTTGQKRYSTKINADEFYAVDKAPEQTRASAESRPIDDSDIPF